MYVIKHSPYAKKWTILTYLDLLENNSRLLEQCPPKEAKLLEIIHEKYRKR